MTRTVQHRRTETLLRMRDDWMPVLTEQAAAAGMARAEFIRTLIAEGLRRRRVSFPEDTLGVFPCKPTTKRGRSAAKRRATVARYRARKRAKEEAERSGTTWLVYDATGLITTAELQALATSVGYVHADGEYQPETTRYTVQTLVDVIRPRVESGELTDARWSIFLARYSSSP